MQVLKFIKDKFKIKFVRQFLTLFTGSVLGQVILFALSPILSRMYAKEIFGMLFTFTSLSAVLQVVASLKLGFASVLPQKDSHAINLFVLAMFVNIILNLFFFFLVFLFYDTILQISGENNLGKWFYFVPLSSFLIGFFEIVSYWDNRMEDYKKISYAKISKSLTTGRSQLLLNFIKNITNGLITGSLLGQGLSAIIIFGLSFKSVIFNLKYFSLIRTIVLLRKYRDIPVFNTLIAALNTLSNQIPFILLGKYFGAETVAFYGMAARVVQTPMGLIANSAGQVFYKTASDIINKKDDIFGFVKKTYLNLGKLIILPVIGLFVGSFFFDFIFGQGWEQAGLYAAILLPWLTVAFLNSPVSWLITVLNKQKTVFFFDMVLLIMRFLSIYLSYKLLFGEITAVAMYSMTGFLFGIFMFFYLIKISKSQNT